MSTETAVLPEATPAAQTRLRLLEAAAAEFAEHGFHHATVRDICKRAEANVAAVNYHFGDKERLYAATLKHWIGIGLTNYPLLMGVAPDAPAVDRLRGFIRGSLRRMLDTSSAGWHGQLMAREMVEPTAAIDSIIGDTIRPMVETLHAIVREVAGPNVTEEQVARGAMSVVGQCCFYKHARPVLERMFGPSLYTEEGLQAAANHVTDFSLAGIRSLVAAPNAASL